jgi:phosphoribosylformylglycinamidine synthase
MAVRIGVRKTVPDSRASAKLAHFRTLGLSKKPSDVAIVDCYVIDASISASGVRKIAEALINPLVETVEVNSISAPGKFSHAIEIGFHPGVTDNVGNTCREMICDLLKAKFKTGEAVYSSKIYFVSGVSDKDAKTIADSLHNPLIERARVLSYQQYEKEGGFGALVPKVKLPKPEAPLKIDLEVSDDELVAIGKLGILGRDGKRRGPLALDLLYMKAIREHFRTLKRKPTDIELETLAQTWSEHCKHTILSSPLDEIKEGLFKTYIKGATEYVRTKKGEKDICVSVFKDNSGAIAFDDEYLVTHKVETHNSPSALDPFGGAITGIVGVNRDALGFGLGARPIANTYGFCLADPKDKREFWRDKDRTQKMLSSRRIMDGVIEGVRAGGNQSGIPTPHGFLSFDPRYRGKPLVFVGTLGLIPRERNGRKLYEKEAQPGDFIVMLGGRVGADGIHGATFSSEAIDAGSPATAVQIGDPITQKKFTDAIVREARNLGLYTSITDNGAGGLSSSVGEMAKESGGCQVDLDKVPLKYPGLAPWQIWISESQERMTLAVPPKKWQEFDVLMKKRGVEATVIGKFTQTGKCIVTSGGKKMVDISLEFLHEGLPVRELHTKKPVRLTPQPVPESRDIKKDLLELMARPSIASRAFIADQYDHEVQASSVIKPLQGSGRVHGDAAVVKPVLTSERGVVVADALFPTYSDLDTYAMAASSIDSALRAAVVAGADPNKIALLDNFCWCSSFDEARLYELKRAAKACFDAAVAYEAPFVSGKDSMFNDFKGYDDKGPVAISVPPTLLATAISVVDDVLNTVSIDFKQAGDRLYLLGETNDELGGSEFSQMRGERENVSYGGNVPQVSFDANKKIYAAYADANAKGYIASGISVGRGGLAVAFAKSCMAGMLGAEINLGEIPGNAKSLSQKLFSETQGRILLSVAAGKSETFEKSLAGLPYKRIGIVLSGKKITIANGKMITITLAELLQAYRSMFAGF